MSLRNKISLFLISISLVAVFATGLLVLQNAVADKKNYITELNSALGPHVANSIDQKLKNLLVNLTEVNSVLNSSMRLKYSTTLIALNNFKKRSDDIDAIFINTKDNRLISFALNETVTSDSLSQLGEIVSTLDGAYAVRDKLTYFKNNLYVTKFKDNTFVAVLLNQTFFKDSFELARGKPAILITDKQDSLVQSNLQSEFDSLLNKVPVDTWNRSELISFELSDERHRNYLINFSRNKLLNTFVVLVSPQPSWKDLTTPILRSSFGLIILLIILSVLIAYWISKSLAHPIEELSEMTGHVGRGDWKIINIKNAGIEIIKLTAAFNRMIENLKKREYELKVAQNKIIQADSLAAVGRMSAGIAHEVKNPLASISGYAQLIERKILSAKDPSQASDLLIKIQEYIKLLLDDTRRANKIISDLLTFARQKEIQLEKINLLKLMQSFEPHLRALCESQKIVFKTEFLSIDAVEVSADSDQIYHVMLNLIQNAIHALNSVTTVNKTVTLRASAANECAEIQVIDNGSGISEENMKKIFEPFFSTKKVGEGTGLGLALCYGIIQQHQGSIDVSSELGIQTNFKIRLPLAD